MSKIPDFSKIAKNIDLSGIVRNVKEMVNPGGLDPIEGDAVSQRMAHIVALLQEIAKDHAEHAKKFSRIQAEIEQLHAAMYPPKTDEETQPEQPSSAEDEQAAHAASEEGRGGGGAS